MQYSVRYLVWYLVFVLIVVYSHGLPSSSTTNSSSTEPTEPPIPKVRTRLANGVSPWEGRVEISLRGGPWGTVCDDGFNMNAANVVCRMVGYKKAVQYFFGGSEFGRGGGSILLDEISCRGTEKTLLACDHSPVGVNDCSHAEDVGVRCSEEETKVRPVEKKLKKYKFRLAGDSTPRPLSSGVVEVFMTSKWRTMCADGWDIHDARVLCGSLGFKEAIGVEPSEQNKRRQRKKSMVLSKFECEGFEHNVSSCERTYMDSYKECESKRAAEVQCERGTFVMDAPQPIAVSIGNTTDHNEDEMQKPDVRLKSGARFGEGRVEVYHEGHWGTICGDDFDMVSASIVCRQLGFGTAMEVMNDATGVGQGVGPIWMWDVICKGTESSIMECSHGEFNRSKCDHSQDVGIRCNIPDLGVQDEIRLASGRYDMEGRVEVLVDGEWGNVCGGDTWDMFDAIVVCRQLGLGYAHQPFKSTRYMGSSDVPMLMASVNCTGTERSLQECPYVLMTNATCPSDFKAGVLCAHNLPDVLIDMHVLQSSIYLQDWPTYLLQCAWEENCLSTVPDVRGVRRLLRFASAIMNRGTAEFRPLLGRSSWEWHLCHAHYHSMQVFSHYDLFNHEGVRVAEGHKASFCLEDVYCDSGARQVYNCNAGDQGISVNCVDIYRNDIDCQWIDVTRVEPGSYILSVDVNPEYLVGESDFTNNEVVCDLFLSHSRVRITNCRYADDS